MAKKKISLIDAVFSGDEKSTASALASSPGDVHRQDGMGFTALHWAADLGMTKIAAMLLDAGASPDIQDMDGLTPLHFAAIKGSLEAASLMIPLADIDLVDFKWEKTALELALDSVRMASLGHDIDRGVPCQKVADLLAAEPSRRLAAEQAAVLDAASNRGVASTPKARI